MSVHHWSILQQLPLLFASQRWDHWSVHACPPLVNISIAPTLICKPKAGPLKCTYLSIPGQHCHSFHSYLQAKGGTTEVYIPVHHWSTLQQLPLLFASQRWDHWSVHTCPPLVNIAIAPALICKPKVGPLKCTYLSTPGQRCNSSQSYLQAKGRTTEVYIPVHPWSTLQQLPILVAN